MSKIDLAVEAIKKTMIAPMVAEIGGFRPPQGITSQFGGGFCIAESEWPRFDGQFAMPVLQVVVAELPTRPQWAKGIELIQVFQHPQELPVDVLPAKNGDRFRVRTSATIPDLPPFQPDQKFGELKRFPVRWRVGEPEPPSWEDVWHFVDKNVLEAAIAEGDGTDFFGRFDHCYSTKIGGYPTYCQGAIERQGEFAFQVGSEEKANFMVGDAGSMFFFVKDGQWHMHWDCC